jgi:hypothetical protein
MKRSILMSIASLGGACLLQAALALEPLVSPTSNLPIVAENDNSRQPDQPLTPQEFEDLRLNQIVQGLAPSSASIQPADAVKLMAALQTRLKKFIHTSKQSNELSKPLPTSLDGFEKHFWTVHVFHNQLLNAERYYQYAQQLKPTAKKYKPRKNEVEDHQGMQTAWDALRADLVTMRTELTRHDRDARISRLSLADKVLTNSKDVEQRLLAALAIDLDGDTLPQQLSKDKSASESQTRAVKQTIDHARKMAGRELMQKSRLLFTGLHWWTRGRYGVGTAGGGFLKDVSALRSPAAQFGLMMPIEPQVPTGANAREQVPLVDRRHHYLWRFETRQIVGGAESQNTKSTEFVLSSTSVTTMTHFY